jgi:hypothetical protein
LLAAGGVLAGGIASVPASSAASATRPCSSYPRPGTISRTAHTPARLGGEYGVLRRPRRSIDKLTISHLRSLSASGIVTNGIRFLHRVPMGGRVYLVPALHLLAFPLVPPRCVPPEQRQLQRQLLPRLDSEYLHHALCLVVIYSSHDNPTCSAAPGTFDPLLYVPGAPGLGMVPDGISAVVVKYINAASRRVKVHHNFWIRVDPKQLVAPCGVNWLNGTGTVLRTAVSCTHDKD